MKYKNSCLYYFNYMEPITRGLKHWDSTPLVLPLAVSSTHLMGINIHWLKLKDRKKFINQILSMKNSTPKLVYNQIKRDFKYALRGIRSYIISKISNSVEINHNNWKNIGLSHGEYKRNILEK